MENLIIKGKIHPVDKEIEIVFNYFGADILIIFNDNTFTVRKNCTEFHHLYNKKSTDEINEPSSDFTYRSAFESDIHQTGSNIEVSRIKSIIIQTSNQIYDKHHY